MEAVTLISVMESLENVHCKRRRRFDLEQLKLGEVNKHLDGRKNIFLGNIAPITL